MGCVLLLCARTARAQQFVDNGDGTVTDQTTGLTWEQSAGTIGPSDPTDVRDVNNRYNWSKPGSTDPDGAAFSEFLATLNDPRECFANNCHWRLPSIEELRTIVDKAAPGCGFNGPCIDPVFGPTQGARLLVSHFPHWRDNGVAWIADFRDGNLSVGGKTERLFVRAVSSISAPPRFTDNGDGTVSDSVSGLMWEKKTPGGTGGVHDVGKSYSWSEVKGLQPPDQPDGTAFTVFLATINGQLYRDNYFCRRVASIKNVTPDNCRCPYWVEREEGCPPRCSV